MKQIWPGWQWVGLISNVIRFAISSVRVNRTWIMDILLYTLLSFWLCCIQKWPFLTLGGETTHWIWTHYTLKLMYTHCRISIWFQMECSRQQIIIYIEIWECLRNIDRMDVSSRLCSDTFFIIKKAWNWLTTHVGLQHVVNRERHADNVTRLSVALMPRLTSAIGNY